MMRNLICGSLARRLLTGSHPLAEPIPTLRKSRLLIAQFPEADKKAKFCILMILYFTTLDRGSEPQLPSASWEMVKEFCIDLLLQPASPGMHMAVRLILLAGDDLALIERPVTMLDHKSADVRFN